MKLPDRPPFSWRSDASVPRFEDSGVLTVMDAQCGLCARGARWIARADKCGEFRIIAQQSALGAALMRHFDLDPDDPLSWLYIEEGRAFTSLNAVIRAGRRLGGVNRVLSALNILPRRMQDRLYARVARNRYHLMGRTDLCAMPDPDVQQRLLR